MAKSKYDPITFPTLAEGWARDGLTDEQIAHNLGISKDTFYRYVKKYPDFYDSLKRGKGPVDFEVENALLKRALGGIYEDSTTEDRLVEGKKIRLKKVVIRSIPPDVVACIFWLKNRRPQQWREKVEDFSGNENVEDRMKEFTSLIREGDTK